MLRWRLSQEEKNHDEAQERDRAHHARMSKISDDAQAEVEAENDALRMRLHVSAGEVKALRGVITLCPGRARMGRLDMPLMACTCLRAWLSLPPPHRPDRDCSEIVCGPKVLRTVVKCVAMLS